jgi:hypothetical protein
MNKPISITVELERGFADVQLESEERVCYRLRMEGGVLATPLLGWPEVPFVKRAAIEVCVQLLLGQGGGAC